jgi:hypothetical protein
MDIFAHSVAVFHTLTNPLGRVLVGDFDHRDSYKVLGENL